MLSFFVTQEAKTPGLRPIQKKDMGVVFTRLNEVSEPMICHAPVKCVFVCAPVLAEV